MGKVSTCIALTCHSQMEWQYYSSNLGTKDRCSYCGVNSGPVDQGLKKQFRTILPLCSDCKRDGKETMTRAPLKQKGQQMVDWSSGKKKKK